MIYLEYQIRKEYIVAELCKERYATINTCDGRCFIVRKLNEAQQHESEEKERNIKPIEIKLQLAEMEDLLGFNEGECQENSFIRYYASQYDYLSIKSKDEPPQA